MFNITTHSILAQLENTPAIHTGILDHPEPPETTSKGVTCGRALYDTPPPGSESEGLPRSLRTRTRTQRAKAGFDAETAATQKSNQSVPQFDNESPAHEPTDTKSEMDVGGRATSKSPTPINISDEPEGQPQREELRSRLVRKFQNVLDNSATQTLLEVDSALPTNPAYTSPPPEHNSEARVLSPTEVGVGGGFHLDHPTHSQLIDTGPGNSKTYQHLKRQHNLLPSSRLEDRSFTSSSGVSEINTDNVAIPLQLSQPAASRLPSQPICDRTSPFYATADAPHPTSQVPDEPNDPPPFGIPTDSQSLGDPIITRPSSQGALPCIDPNTGAHMRARSAAQTLGRPSPLPTTPVQATPARKVVATSTQGLIGKIYSTRLNIIEINSQRPPTTRRGRQPRHNWSAPSSQHRVNTTPVLPMRSTSQQQPSCKAHCQPPPSEISDEEPDLLDGFDVDQHVADSAAKGIMVKSRASKPTVLDLHGVERAMWKIIRNITWGFSISQGNFQTRGVFASWLGTIHSQVFKHNYPDLALRPMSDNMSKVILNSLSNCRYQDLLHVRELVKDFYCLKNPSSEEERAENQSVIDEVYPRSFHCVDPIKEVSPYESEVMARALADIFFYGPAAIGATYPGLFERTIEPRDERKHLPILAYLATMIQFSLGEWRRGFFKKGKLNANTMLSVFICHYEGLKIVAHKARDRLIGLYNKWFSDALASSQAQAVFKKKSFVQPIICPEAVRPDTPCQSPAPSSTTWMGPMAPASFCLPPSLGHALPMDPASRHNSSNTTPTHSYERHLMPCHSPSHRLPTTEVPCIIRFGTPPLDQLRLQLSPPHNLTPTPRNPTPPHNPTPTPERDADGNLTTRAKGKGPAID
ncbi:hypothetical protein CTheo_7894 [Ceratobasidium theobromae]|uniref:DUF6532 domain-containing protein n=1 Tax=Ceratobasidium theobromae TaxID=1582974 RepID=A0A5N5QB98_9AGAM|nr:hypothetical protein CTheo_7894 [Ceratobasidium theobromae]